MSQEILPSNTNVPFVPTDTKREIIYPESDGEPMAETDMHRNLMSDLISILSNHFKEKPDVYISGNLFLYYEEDNPSVSVAPDVFVVFGVEKKQRRTYRMWEEGKGPDFVLEVASKKTYKEDLGKKKKRYADVLKVKEYFLYDPDDQYLPSRLMGYRLKDGRYLRIQPVEGRLPSFTLGLELGEKDAKLGLYNPQTKRWLLNLAEESDARKRAEMKATQESFARRLVKNRAEQAEIRAEQAEVEAQQEAFARQEAETKAEQAEIRAEQAEVEAQQEAFARQEAETKAEQAETRAEQAESELARLRALLEQ